MLRRRLVWAITVGAVLCALLARGAEAAESSMRVLLVVDQNDDPFAERIRAELVGLGMEVVTLEPWRSGEAVESLDGAARAMGATAAVRMIHSRRGVEVWTADQPTGRSLLRQLIVDESPREPNQGLVALQTAELLRTSMLANSTPHPNGTPKSAVAQEATTQQGPASIAATQQPWHVGNAGLQAAVGALYSPGAGDAAMQVSLSLYRMMTPRLALAIDVSIPITESTITGPEGSASVSTMLGGGAVVMDLDPRVVGLYATAGVGLGVARVAATGAANMPFTSHTQTAVSPIVYARGDAGIEATRWLRFGVRAILGVAAADVTLRFAGNDAGTWGRPFLAASLISELTWR